MRLRDIRPALFAQRRGASCVQVARTMPRYLDGDLDEAARARVAGHLAAYRRCGLDAHAYREIKTALARRGERVPDAPIDRLRAFAAELSPGDPPSSPTTGR